MQKHDDVEALTLSNVGDVLMESILPYYRGFPGSKESGPNFRKTLTGEESTNLLTTIHQLIHMIRIQERAT